MSCPGLNHIFQSVKSAFLPALIFAVAAFYDTAFPIRNFENSLFFHGLFLGASVIGLVFLSLVQKPRELLLLMCMLGAYLFINGMKTEYGAEFFEQTPYFLLLALMPLNILLMALLPPHNLKDINNFYILGLLLGEGVLLENMPLDLPLPHLLSVALLLWLLLSVFLLVKVCQSGSLYAESLFFTAIALFLCLMNATTPESLCLYGATAVLILLLGITAELFYAYFKDEETGTYSRSTFYRHASKRLPLKYSLAVVCIDDYQKLRKVFTSGELRALLKLILKIIHDMSAATDVYRYNADEFVLILKKEDKKQAYQLLEAYRLLENIRREIAGTTFVLSRKKSVKITISAGVSEKKRSDAGAEAVLNRARGDLQKSYKFTQNITVMA